MNLLYRRTCGLACLAIFTAIVLAGCGQATSRTAAPEAVRIASETLEIGETDQISLSNKFSGEKLTYTATSNNTAVATAKIDGATLTVTAVGAGTATITVTATDPQERSAKTSFTVTVPQPEEEEEEGAPTVRSGATDSVDVDQGDTETVTLSRVFTGADLEFTVSSSDLAAATASESAGILTITARSPGSATITIVATNDAGTVTHQIAVTVPEPVTTPPITTPPTTPQEDCSLSGSSLTITVRIVRENSKRCTLPDKHSLVYHGGEVQARKDSSATTNVWTITARLKGRHVIQIREDESGDTVGEITVIVPNTPPRLDALGGLGTDTPLTLAGSDETGLHTGSLTGIRDAFEDVDDADNEGTDNDEGNFNYRVHHKPEGLLVKTVRGFLLEANSADADQTITTVVLKQFEAFAIEIHAYDLDNARSDNAVTVNFVAVNPVSPGPYNLEKGTGTTYQKPKIGNRIDVLHTINLSNTADDEISNYNFLDFITPSAIGERIQGVDSDDVDFEECASSPPDSITANNDQGDGCWSAQISGREARIGTFSSSTPATVSFALGAARSLNDASDVTITIRYYVVAQADDTTTTDRNELSIVQVGSGRPLSLDIHGCVDTADCP